MLLDVRNLTTRFHTRNGVVHAVEDVSFSVEKGQTLGIVGESGSGKSVTCYSLLGLIPTPPGRIERGSAIFDGTDLLKASEKQLRSIRGKRISMIFQDPMTSLNPYMRISDQITEPLEIHEGIKGKQALTRAIDALAEVGIPDPEKRIKSYPHEFSGGMRQRVMIAMALITKPELLICDEPSTALDVTVQKQVLDLIRQRQKDLGTAIIFITHDLAVVSEVCDVINVMYAGRIVESATRSELFSNPLHAYTRSLLKSIPAAQPKGEPLITIPGLPPNLAHPPAGCAFQPRNLLGKPELCLTDHSPELSEITPGHFAQNCPGCLA
ncbi:MAG: ABC transporter ATP-binding protein [Akkermansiaceae bacterium]|nr:ABC transporter ATP-binding protein [Akkermansiaceae bacterium]MDP4722476.1 ABC transporter ATP-binding protein [Akkermansiaceae bacterium]MDP4778642.1 ABC transporter ATP-binding protein [Akkermansiaceae bacterium]MDP4899179.1 ABC transporter ATP-binding protein [Akkermansiaceae bacterium]MDP4995668.1 ABC transporter ATP-binding protein [Akkermansiaceae bacterium]